MDRILLGGLDKFPLRDVTGLLGNLTGFWGRLDRFWAGLQDTVMEGGGGVGGVASALGPVLLERLRAMGMTFEVADG